MARVTLASCLRFGVACSMSSTAPGTQGDPRLGSPLTARDTLSTGTLPVIFDGLCRVFRLVPSSLIVGVITCGEERRK
jgi:hypothetical protein